MGRVSDTVLVGFNWKDGSYIEKKLHRSFETLEEAERFAEGKNVRDIYRCKGRYKVEWIKKTCEWN